MLNIDYGLGTLKQQKNFFYNLEIEGLDNIRNLKRLINTPDYERQPKTLNLSEVSTLTNIPRTSIRDKEKSGHLKYKIEKSSKPEYTLEDINIIRQFFSKGFFNGQVIRPKTLPPITISVSMFKGGVGKTTHSSHLAAHLCLSGLRVLLIDLDPQASASLVFGYIPSVDIESGQTIFRTLVDDFNHIHSVIKKTYYSGLDLIPSGLELQSADLLLPDSRNNNMEKLGSPIFRLSKSLSLVKDNYDVIILDCPPNHAATTMNALTASNGILIPVSPNMLSYGSSIQFIHTLHDLTNTLIESEKQNLSHEEKNLINLNINTFFRILITNDPGDKEAQDVTAAIRSLYKDFVLPRPMCKTIALARAANDMGLMYDTRRRDVRGAKEAFDRGLYAMKAVNDDVVTLLKSIWNLKHV